MQQDFATSQPEGPIDRLFTYQISHARSLGFIFTSYPLVLYRYRGVCRLAGIFPLKTTFTCELKANMKDAAYLI